MTDKQMATITDQIMKAAAKGNRARVEDLVEALLEAGREEGKNDLLIDMWDGKEITPEAVEFAIENNGCKDPR
ncbi:hypothetical protein HCN51_31575 [Nonomuraea sp. FMUSA5-5]|uniref:Antitoxin n=1 Tax=Nonomuraea composti TaxID=2720023 RepID=A0ABX1B7Z4_9ACTN|nr:hypothetical protein [Nonomuraea sp. FMUSA5-5]NJP93925.1 hypothetical protein [Nonomuraea sp. FMUSA5-5]